LKKAPLTLLALLIVAAAITVGCGSSHVPTFSKLAFSSDREVSPATELFSMGLDGSAVTPVPFSTTDVWSPSVSADFTKYAFTSDLNIWIGNFDGSSQTQLTTDGETVSARISPDGTKIVYGNYNETTNVYNVWVMNVDGTGAVNLTTTLPAGMIDGCYAGNFSNDSKKVVIACYSEGTSGLYYVKADVTGATTTVLTSTGFFDTPSFTPNGKQIVFAQYTEVSANACNARLRKGKPASHQTVRTHGCSAPNYGLSSVNIDGSNLLTIVPSSNEAVILNSTLYYTLFDGSSDPSNQIYSSGLDRTNPVKLSDGTANDYLRLEAY